MSRAEFETPPHDERMIEAPPSKSGCGCWAWGCLTVFVIGILGTVGIVVGGYMFISNQVQAYTSETPQKLPVVQYTDEEIAKLETRIEDFKSEAESGDSADELVLTAADINALIQSNEDVRGKIFVKIDSGKVTGDVSVPTDKIPGGKGRYFNATATFDVSMDKGVLIVTLSGAEVNGEEVPAQFIEAMGKENLAKDMYKNPETAEMMRRVETVTVDEDKIIMKLRAKTKAEDEAESVDSEKDDVEDSEHKPANVPAAEEAAEQVHDFRTEYPDDPNFDFEGRYQSQSVC